MRTARNFDLESVHWTACRLGALNYIQRNGWQMTALLQAKSWYYSKPFLRDLLVEFIIRLVFCLVSQILHVSLCSTKNVCKSKVKNLDGRWQLFFKPNLDTTQSNFLGILVEFIIRLVSLFVCLFVCLFICLFVQGLDHSFAWRIESVLENTKEWWQMTALLQAKSWYYSKPFLSL